MSASSPAGSANAMGDRYGYFFHAMFDKSCFPLTIQVFLAKHKHDGKCYAVKVLQKKFIVNRKEVTLIQSCDFIDINTSVVPVCVTTLSLLNWLSHQQKHIMAERNVLLKNVKHPFLVGLHYSFQTTDKLYFVLDFINGGEVSGFCLNVTQMALLRNDFM